MFRRAQYKIVLGVFLFIMVICVFGLIYTHNFPHGEIYYIVKQQSDLISKEIKYSSTVNTQRPDLSLSEVKQNDKNTAVLPPKVVYKQDNEPGEIQQSTTKQPNSPPGEVKHEEQPTVPTTAEIVQHLVNLTDDAKFTSYVKNLSSSQVNDVVKYMGVSDLTSRESQEQFLICAGMKLLLKQLKDKPPDSSIQIPSSFQHCKTMSFKSSKSRAVLESFPGSGNSYVRQLLESATGIYTGAIYCDPSYLKVGMIGEGVETENVLAIKSHVLLNPKVLPKLYDKAIYIVRNPFDAMVAEINRLITYNTKHEEDHTAVVDYEYGMYHYYIYVSTACLVVGINTLGLRSWNIYYTYMCIGYF